MPVYLSDMTLDSTEEKWALIQTAPLRGYDLKLFSLRPESTLIPPFATLIHHFRKTKLFTSIAHYLFFDRRRLLLLLGMLGKCS